MENVSVHSNTIPNYHFEQLKEIENGYWWYEGRILWAKSFINDWIRERKNDDDLVYADLGCGTGGFGMEIQNAYSISHAYLVDFNTDALEKIDAKKNSKASAENKAKIMSVNLEKDFSLPFIPNLVSCMDVIEHLKEDGLFLKRVAAGMVPGGLLVLSVPAHPFLYSKWDSQLGHFRRYQKRSLEKLILEAGFQIRRSHHVWSFLFPAAPYRLMTGAKQEKLEYPITPKWLNRLLIRAARAECTLSPVISAPFGTSIMVSAIKT